MTNNIKLSSIETMTTLRILRFAADNRGFSNLISGQRRTGECKLTFTLERKFVVKTGAQWVMLLIERY